MALDDWTLVSDGNTYKRITQNRVLGHNYAGELRVTPSSNYASFAYNNANLYSNLENVKFSGRILNNKTYLIDTSLWTDITWASTSATVTATGTRVEKTSGTSGWNAGAVSSQSIADSYLGGGIRFQPLSGNMQMMVGLAQTSALETTYSGMDYVLYFSNEGDTDHKYVVMVYELNNKSYPAQNEEFRFIYKPSDIFSLEFGETGYVDYMINGEVFYRSETPPTFPLYYKATFNELGSGIDNVWIRTSAMPTTSNNKGKPYFSIPFVFVRMQDTTPSVTSESYALLLKDHELALVKGDLNQAAANLEILDTGPSVSENYDITVGNPQILTIETTTVNNSEVQIKAGVKQWKYFFNEITVESAVSPAGARNGRNYNVVVSDDGPVDKAANFVGNSYIYMQNDMNESNIKYIEFWFNARDATHGTLVMRRPDDAGYAYRSYDFGLTLRNNTLIYHYYSDSTPAEAYVNVYINENVWYYVALQRSGATTAAADLWINGVKYVSITGGSDPFDNTAKNPILIGCQTYYKNVTRCNFFNGKIAQFYMIYDAAPYDTTAIASRYSTMNGGSDIGLYDHANKAVLYRFTDTPVEHTIINYSDTDSPLINGGKVGFGVYSDTNNEDSVFFDELEIYTED